MCTARNKANFCFCRFLAPLSARIDVAGPGLKQPANLVPTLGQKPVLRHAELLAFARSLPIGSSWYFVPVGTQVAAGKDL